MGVCGNKEPKRRREPSLVAIARCVNTARSEADKEDVIAVLKKDKDRAERRYANALHGSAGPDVAEREMGYFVEATEYWRDARLIPVVPVKVPHTPKRSLPA
jgi:hypothetical protein